MKRQDVAFGYLFISLFAVNRKGLKACVLLWCANVFFVVVVLYSVLIVK